MYEVVDVDNTLPAVDAAYQSIVFPATVDADNATVPVPHLDPFVPVAIDGNVFTVAITATLDEEIQLVVVFLASA